MFFYSLLNLPYKTLLIIQLGGISTYFSILSNNGSLQLLLATLQISKSLLGDLQLPFHLAPLLLKDSTASFFFLERTLKIIQGCLKFGLDVCQVLQLICSIVKIIRRLCTIFTDV